MNPQNQNIEGQEFDKVVNLLTPKYQRKAEIEFVKPRSSFRKRLWAFGGIAAMLVVISSIIIKSSVGLSASEVVTTALNNLLVAESVKIEFRILANPSNEDEIYSPTPDGTPVDGTLYILNRNGRIYNRIDWHDAERNSILFDGNKYTHLKNNSVVGTHPSHFSGELLNIVNLNTLRNEVGDRLKDSKLSTQGNRVSLSHEKNGIHFSGSFDRQSQQLVGAAVKAKDSRGDERTVLQTNSIETGIELPDSLFR